MIKAILVLIGGLAIIAATFALIAALSLQGAYVAERIWAWHVMPIASWIPAIGWRSFWAMSAVVAVVFKGVKLDVEEKKRESSEKIARFVGLAAAPWLALLMAWVLR